MVASSSCSRAISRSIAWSTVVTGPAVEGPTCGWVWSAVCVGFCAAATLARAPPRSKLSKRFFDVRIAFPPSVCQFESDVDDGRKIHRLPALYGGLETDLARRGLRRIIQPVTQSLHHALDLYVASCGENNLQKHFPFDLFGPSLIRVLRLGLEENLDRFGIRADTGCLFHFGSRRYCMLIRENTLLHYASISAAVRSSSNPIA